MKKGLFLLLLLILGIFVFVGCNNAEQASEPSDAPTASSAVQETAHPTPSPAETADATAAPTAAPATATASPEPTAEPTPKQDQSGGIVSDSPIEAPLFEETTHMAYILSDYPIAIQFYATTEFDALRLSCHNGGDNYGTVVFSLYEWKGNYWDTIEQEQPLETATFVDYVDNDSLKLTFSQPREDGEYLLVVTTPDPSESVGVWYSNDTPHPAQHVFMEDMYFEYAAVDYFILCYTKTPQNLYGPLSDAE